MGSLALDGVMLACTYALTRLAVGRALRPVRTMTDQATQWSAVASEERFGSMRHPAELARLGTSLDAILDRIRTLLRHERQLTGELSHELRTPLSRIIAELDWWQTRPRSTDQTHATHKVIADAAQSMRTICDTLLDDARGGTLTAPGTAEVLPALRRLTELPDVPGHLTVTADGPPTPAATPTPRLPSAPTAHPTAYASRSSTTGPAYRARSPHGSSSPVNVRIRATDTTVRASGCRWLDASHAAPAAR
jgi:hypothetical protein